MPRHDMTADQLAMRHLAWIRACRHAGAVPVTSLAGEVIARLCPECDTQLRPDRPKVITHEELSDALRDLAGRAGNTDAYFPALAARIFEHAERMRADA